jgi:CRISPR-associated protein (TIGR03986 family)
MGEGQDSLRDMIRKSLEKSDAQRQSMGDEPEKPAQTSPGQAGQQAGRYRFLNPYNFARYFDQPRPKKHILGDASPPPHDRYVGLKGKITCTVEAVTPLFVSDSHAIEGKSTDHRTYRFFRTLNEVGELEYAIPATSLRCMLRNVFETVTNSCFSVFDYDKRLSYHLFTGLALQLIPARAEKADDERWTLRLLPGSSKVEIGARPGDKLYAARVEQYEALVPGRQKKGGGFRKPLYQPVNLKGLQHGQKCYAVVEDFKFPPVWHVHQVARSRNELSVPRNDKQRIVEGYLVLNNQNIESKRFERLFFRIPGNVSCPESIPLPAEVREKYEDLITDYQERHRDTIKKWRARNHNPSKAQVYRAAFSRFVIGGPQELQHGDLVYAMLEGSPQKPRVKFIVPVAIPRVGYEHKIVDLLPGHLRKCEEYDQLCPACRLFGWVYGRHKEQQELDPEVRTAYASRLRFGHGRLKGKRVPDALQVTLAILSSPKATTSRFYLRPDDGRPQDGLNDQQAGYDNPQNTLRGRKIYRHHGHSGDMRYWFNSDRREYSQAGNRKNDQNRTVVDALAPGTQFTFEIDFENLAQVELGALLWTLQLNGNAYHRLGFAKPLGFGGVRLTVDKVVICELDQRFMSIDSASEQDVSTAQQGAIIEAYKESMRSIYGLSFDDLPPVRDLLALLSDPENDLPIHYPRTSPEPDPEGKNFEWFMGNNRGGRNAGPRLSLPFADEDTEGLPLLDRFGNEVD